MAFILDLLLDTLLDTIKMAPFLLLAYWVIEYLERRQGDRLARALGRERWGAAAGAVLGCFPQCGFSAMAAELYANRVITLGTLLAVFLSTSDEAIPLLLATPGSGGLLVRLLGVKIAAGLGFGLLADLIFARARSVGQAVPSAHGDSCGCGCGKEEHSLLRAAVERTLQLMGIVFLISLGIGLLVGLVGEDVLSAWLGSMGTWQIPAAALVGLIPNCAVSVLLTQLCLAGDLTFAATAAGLSSGAGVGLLVLFQTNRPRRDSLRVLGLLYGAAVATGLLCALAGM